MDWPINKAIIANPVNWAIVLLMLVFAIYIAELLAVWAGKKGSCGCSKNH